METALHGDKWVTVGMIQRMRKCSDERATCPLCRKDVFVSAERSVVKTASFNHWPPAQGEQRCPLSHQSHPSYSWLDDVPQEAVAERAQLLKSRFYQERFLKQAFTFLTSVTGKGAVNSAVFALLLKKADKHNIWSYARMPLWAVPYILLTLRDFTVRPVGKRAYQIRFVIDKPPRSKLDVTWLKPEQCSLAKYFVNDDGKAKKLVHAGQGQSTSSTGARVSSVRYMNPLPFSEDAFVQLSSDIDWIKGGLDVMFQ